MKGELTKALGCSYAGHEFGASYPDSICIDGYLWDADSDDDGDLTSGGDLACPRCNTAQFLEDALEEAKDGGCGKAMFTPWCAAVVWENAVAKALRENPEAASVALSGFAPFATDDWPDRQAVYDGRAPWERTVEIIIEPAAISRGDQS